jgi:putative DNA primase/helicase
MATPRVVRTPSIPGQGIVVAPALHGANGHRVTHAPSTAAAWARAYEARGWSVLIMNPGDKESRTPGWPDHTPLDAGQYAQLETFGANLGLRLGPSKLIDVDLDCPEAVALAGDFLPLTACFGRPGKARSHYLYTITDTGPAVVKYEDIDKTVLVELRAGRHMVMVPPSQHPNGEYLAFEGGPGTFPEAVPMPASLPTDVRDLAIAILLGRHWPGEGARHDASLAAAGFLLREGFTPERVERIIAGATQIAGDDQVGDRLADVRTTAEKLAAGEPATGGPTLEQVLTAGKKVVAQLKTWLKADPPPAPTVRVEGADLFAGDLDNAATLVERYGHEFRYSSALGWLRWDGRRWTEDDTLVIQQRAKTVARDLLLFLPDAINSRDRDGRAKRIISAQEARRIGAMMKLATSEPPIPVSIGALDTDTWLLTVRNGTIDLRTGALRPHRPEDLITKLAPVDYDPEAPCPRWERFLAEIFAGDAGLIEFMQRFVGHCLTGDVREHVFSIWHGAGRNGKSTLKEIQFALMGDYALSTPATTFLEKRPGDIPNDLARLRGARLVVAVEPEHGAKLATAMVKEMTGGDRIPARFLRREWFHFYPTFKPVLITNARPIIRDVTHAMWARVRLIPFDVIFHDPRETAPGLKQDKHLGSILRGELSGILNWAIAGCLAWQREGLGGAAKIAQATADYRVESDWFAAFLAAHCEMAAEFEVNMTDLFNRFRVWGVATEGRAQTVTASWFGRMLSERGIGKRETTVQGQSVTVRTGLRLRPSGGA